MTMTMIMLVIIAIKLMYLNNIYIYIGIYTSEISKNETSTTAFLRSRNEMGYIILHM